MIDPELFQATRYPVSGLAQILQAIYAATAQQQAQAERAQQVTRQEAYERYQLLHGIAQQYTSAGQEPPQEVQDAISQAGQVFGLPATAQQQVPIPGTGAAAVPAGPPTYQQNTPSEVGPMAAAPLPGTPAVPAVPPQTQLQYVWPGAAARAQALASQAQTIGQFAKNIGMTLREGVNPDIPTAEFRRQGISLEALFEPPAEQVAFLDTRTGQIQPAQFPAGTVVKTYASPGEPATHVVIYPDGHQVELPPGVIPTMAPASEGPVNVYNTKTGQTITLPAGTKLFTPPNAPEQQIIVYPDGHRETVPAGQRLTFAPTAAGPGQVSPADKEVLSLFFDPNKFASLNAADQAATRTRVRQALRNLGIDVPAQLPPPASSWWDRVRTWLVGQGGAAPASVSPTTPPGAGAAPQSYRTVSSGVITAAQVQGAIANMRQQGLTPAQIRQKLVEDNIPPGAFGF